MKNSKFDHLFNTIIEEARKPVKKVKPEFASDELQQEFRAALKDWKPLGKYKLFEESRQNRELYLSWDLGTVTVYLENDGKMRVETYTHEDCFDKGDYQGVKDYIEQRYRQDDF